MTRRQVRVNTDERRRWAHCRRRGCLCTHEPPCDHGWIDTTTVDPWHESCEPCPTCRPELFARMCAAIEGESRDVE